METIRVNMAPCEDVQTIHASQNDNEAREWGFELHNNGDKIDSSSISDQLVFKAYEGGTEEILPTNGSTPTTSPFLGDIRYPQGLLTDQEFLYRQSPTEEDGLAWITDIKGNTLVWNQLAKVKDSFTSATSNGITLSRVDDHFHIEGTATSTATFNSTVNCNEIINFPPGHKFLLSINPKNVNVSFGIQGYGLGYYQPTITVVRPSSETTVWRGVFQFRVDNGVTVNTDLYLQAIDLTQMFGSGNEPSTVEEFTSLFPLDYYDFNIGSLLSFNGNGIKTVGKNLLDANIGIAYGGGSGMRWYESQGFMLMANKTYTFSASNTGGASVAVYIIDHATRNSLASSSLVTTYTPTQNVIVYLQAYRGSGIPSETEFQLEFGSQTAYEPYTESVINLPISTYFPTGMKQAGTVYDELLPNKAITRIGEVTVDGTNTGIGATALTNVMRITIPIDTAKYNSNQISNNLPFLVSYTSDTEHFYVSDTYIQMFIDKTKCGTTFNSVKQYLSSNPTIIYYELATPTETEITTASLVTENAEIPLSNEDGVLIGKCTDQLSAEPGFHDAKIKLADEDGECYSNKIQLHIERSPQ